MKYLIDAHEFSFNKIKNGSRKIAINLYDKSTQRIKIKDILDIRNISSGEHIECQIKGIALFDNFNDLVDAITPQALGYSDKNEVMVRLNRMFSKELQISLNAVAFYLEPLSEKLNFIERGEYERD